MRLKRWFFAHKIVTLVMLLGLVVGVYKTAVPSAKTEAVRNVYGTVRVGDIVTTVTGTGQVSAENQLDIKGKVSADITNIYVKAGDRVKAGALLAQIDARNAGLTLQNANPPTMRGARSLRSSAIIQLS